MAQQQKVQGKKRQVSPLFAFIPLPARFGLFFSGISGVSGVLSGGVGGQQFAHITHLHKFTHWLTLRSIFFFSFFVLCLDSFSQLSSTAKVARWFQQLPWHTASLSRPESGFVSGDSRSEKYQEDHFYGGMAVKETQDDLCDEFLLVEGSSTIWTKLSAKKRRKLLGMRLGKVTTF